MANTGGPVARAAPLLAALLFLSGCGGDTPFVAISGTLVDDLTGEPIAGARVIRGGFVTLSDASGRFELRGSTGAALTVTAPGHAGFTLAVPTRADDCDLGTLYMLGEPLQGTGNITLTVHPPVSDDSFVVACGERRAAPRGSGRYSLYNLPTGLHTVTASLDSRPYGEVTVTVVAGQTVLADVWLRPLPPPPVSDGSRKQCGLRCGIPAR